MRDTVLHIRPGSRVELGLARPLPADRFRFSRRARINFMPAVAEVTRGRLRNVARRRRRLAPAAYSFPDDDLHTPVLLPALRVVRPVGLQVWGHGLLRAVAAREQAHIGETACHHEPLAD